MPPRPHPTSRLAAFALRRCALPLTLSALAACAPATPPAASDATPADDDSGPPGGLVASLTARGPHAVGYRTGEVAYPDPASPATERLLRLALWYPSDDAAGTEAVYQGIFPSDGVWQDAHASPGPFPVAVFSHGHQGYAENSGFLMAHLASHGWLVAAPDHTGNTTFDGAERTTDIYYQRPLDVSAVLDHLAALPADDPLAGLPGEPVVALGHSFGGYTVLALAGAAYDLDTLLPACEDGTDSSSFCGNMTAEAEALFAAGFSDPRLAGVVAMAAGDYRLFGAAGASATDVPVLLMTGELDGSTASDGEPYWDALAGRGGDLRVHLLGGGHQTFTDFSGILEDAEGLIEAEEGFRIIDAYTLAWARHLAGDPAVAGVLDGTLPVSDQAVLME